MKGIEYMMKKQIAFILAFLIQGTAHGQTSEPDAVSLCTQAADYYKGSNGKFLNKEKAFELYKQAAEMNYTPAILEVADFYYYGEVVEKDFTSYFKWVEKAANLGDADAQNRLGVCYNDEKGTEVDIEKAYYWYCKAAEKGNINAMNNLRILCNNNTEYRQEIIKWTRMGAENGHKDCMYALGEIYNNGDGLKEDVDQAEYWYKLAADKGHKSACNALGVIFHNEREDYKQAVFYIKKAIELGENVAYFNLGFMYEIGHGVDIDYIEAEKCYQKAIETKASNQNSARYQLGKMYYEGNDVIKRNKKKGEELLKVAAENNHQGAKKYLEEHRVKWSMTTDGNSITISKKTSK